MHKKTCWCSWWRYKRFRHIVPSVWTPCCAMQPPGAASWLSLHPKSPHALSLGSLLSLVLWRNWIAVFKVKATAKYQNVSDCLSRWCLLKCWTLYYQTCYSYASLWAKLSYKKCLFAVFKAQWSRWRICHQRGVCNASFGLPILLQLNNLVWWHIIMSWIVLWKDWIALLWWRSRSQKGLRIPVNVHLNDISWMAEPFVTRLGMVMHYHKPKCHARK